METYLLGFGVFVTILFMIGVFYTAKEFREMESHPEEYHQEKDHLHTSE
ncbi:hypothetical protein [Fodinibius saliphilus]|nr:hypothetical protein [Fodinibius saliphilus]